MIGLGHMAPLAAGLHVCSCQGYGRGGPPWLGGICSCICTTALTTCICVSSYIVWGVDAPVLYDAPVISAARPIKTKLLFQTAA